MQARPWAVEQLQNPSVFRRKLHDQELGQMGTDTQTNDAGYTTADWSRKINNSATLPDGHRAYVKYILLARMSRPLSVSMSVLGAKAGQAWARGAGSDRRATAQARDVCRCRRLVLEDSWSPAAAGALAARGRVRAPRGWTHACIALSSIVGAMGRMWVRLWEKVWGYGRRAGGTHAGERRRCGVMRGCICPSRDLGRCDPGHWCTPGPCRRIEG